MYATLFLLLLHSLAPTADPAAGVPGLAAATPVEAAAPAAAVPAPAPAVAALRADLERLLRSPGWRGDRWSVMVVSLDHGDTLFAHEPDAALAPASNMKLFTSAAALYYLGPEFRYSTYLMTDGEIAGDTLRGDLILYGTGDPTISDRFHEKKTSVWESFADTLAAMGITRIEGDIVGDASYFGGTSVGQGWQESYMNAWYAAPASALSFNNNIVTLHITPAAEPGWRPEIQRIPGGEGIAIVNQATTVRSGRTRIDVNRAAYDGPIVVRGQIAAGASGVWHAVPVADPGRYSAAVLRETLEKRGLEVSGRIRSIDRPEASPLSGRSVFAPAFDDSPPLRVLTVHRSPPILDILGIVNRRSHNLYAEAVLRTVGRVGLGEGSVEAGARAVHYLIECETGADAPALRIYDGSGLSVLNRVSARTVIRLLGYMADSPMWEAYRETLPEAGSAQGLRRMYRTAAEGNLRAKTGTIDNVSALSGYVRAANGERLAFSIISNRVPSTWRAKRVEDAIGARIAGFSRPRPAPAAGAARTPAPVVPAGGAAPGPGTGAAATGEAAGRGAPAPAAARSEHVIRTGDTLEAIARKYGTTVGALEAANPGVTPRRLIPGRTLRIPE